MTAVGLVVAAHQMTQARASQAAVVEMLAEQGIEAVAEGRLSLAAFTTSLDMLTQLTKAPDFLDLGRLVASLVQDAGRAAESVATTVRPNVGHVRNLTLPSCSRCAVLAGRVYRYSDGFLRHPNCDCTMLSVREGDETYAIDPVALARKGLVTGLSKADLEALADGADFNQVVNVRRRAAGLRESGRVLARAGRPTPEGIYRMSSTRAEAVALLRRFGYVL